MLLLVCWLSGLAGMNNRSQLDITQMFLVFHYVKLFNFGVLLPNLNLFFNCYYKYGDFWK